MFDIVQQESVKIITILFDIRHVMRSVLIVVNREYCDSDYRLAKNYQTITAHSVASLVCVDLTHFNITTRN